MKSLKRIIATLCVLVMMSTVICGTNYSRRGNFASVQRIVDAPTEIETE